eukprot:CAMPEP_0168741858 /NCGR_PEP_ID=MMETSP0724-20121128/12738_1 /TAXON_ID=265536 /ORGANISM="Amphiprora sp., Strain CCMP467" /LENGTH=264 /DNA_ID=CAMNT_0008789391 /DNA_START=14 /DNA_END=808 /DNA_ORIENTATION=-
MTRMLFRIRIKGPLAAGFNFSAGVSRQRQARYFSCAAVNRLGGNSLCSPLRQGTPYYHQHPLMKLPNREYHCSPACMAIRRRRRGGPPPSADEMEAAKTESSSKNTSGKFVLRDAKLFQAEAQKLLDKIQRVLRPLQQYNDPFRLLRSRDPSIPGEYLVLDLGKEIVDGEFQILMDYDQNLLVFTTPVSGQYVYQCMMPETEKKDDEEEAAAKESSNDGDDDDYEKLMASAEPKGEWMSTQDGHNFEGMLVRDFIRVAKGVPKL